MLCLSNPVATRSKFSAPQNLTANLYEKGKTNLWIFFYSILDILRGEARVLEGLHNLGIKGEHQGKLLRLPVNAVDDSYALDIRDPAIMVSPVQKHYSSGSHPHCRGFLFFLPVCELVYQSSGYCSSLQPARNSGY